MLTVCFSLSFPALLSPPCIHHQMEYITFNFRLALYAKAFIFIPISLCWTEWHLVYNSANTVLFLVVSSLRWMNLVKFSSLSTASNFCTPFLHFVCTPVVRWDVRPPVWAPRIPNPAASQRDALRHHYWLLWQGQGQQVFLYNIILSVVSVLQYNWYTLNVTSVLTGLLL